MTNTLSKVATFALAAGLVGCEAGAATEPVNPNVGAPADLTILTTTDVVSIERELRLEARVVDQDGNPVPGTTVEWRTDDTITAKVTKQGTVTGQYYGPVTVRATSGDLIAERPLEVVPGSRYSSVDLAYFSEVAFGAEYGASARVVRKWRGDVRIKVHGTPTPDDMDALRSVMSDLRSVMNGRGVELVTEEANVDIHFAPESDFDDIDPNYTPTNYGFFWVWWGPDQRLLRSRILISSTDISQDARSHLIREELTQSLGLMNDSWAYPESIYYQGWTRTTEYAPIDRMVIEMLYRPEIRSGMTEAQAILVLAGLTRLQILWGASRLRTETPVEPAQRGALHPRFSRRDPHKRDEPALGPARLLSLLGASATATR